MAGYLFSQDHSFCMISREQETTTQNADFILKSATQNADFILKSATQNADFILKLKPKTN